MLESTPRLSICTGFTANRLPALTRLCESLEKQTCKDFELVACLDTATDDDRTFTEDLANMYGKYGFLYFVEHIRQEENKHLGHRNHARNRAAWLAFGEWLFFCDVDMVLPENWVAHALRVIDDHDVLVFSSPIIYQDERGRPVKHAFGTMTEYIRPNAEPALVWPDYQNNEGMPCMHAGLFEALEGFDESFLGWGSNKVELIQRIHAADLDYPVLASAPITHVWHPPEGDADPELVAKNARLLEEIKTQIEEGAEWWRWQAYRIQELINERS